MKANRFSNIFLPILLALAAIWALTWFSTPFAQLRKKKAETRLPQMENRRLREENRRLATRLEQTKTPEGLRLEAHRLGWLYPGERRMVFMKPAPEKSDKSPRMEVKEPPLFTKMQAWVRKQFRHKPGAV